MTYGELKALVNALLIGDSVFTKKPEEQLVLLKYAYQRIANEADAMKLFTVNKDEEKIIRNGPGRLFVRMPELPEKDIDELDIDEELCYAAARFIASFVSQARPELHENEARKIINLYNQKVQTFLETLAATGELDVYDDEDMFGRRSV
jgi:hypothetical protein